MLFFIKTTSHGLQWENKTYKLGGFIVQNRTTI